MKERGIPFSAPMVRAVINGTKTQTRRVIKDCWGVNDGVPWKSAPTGHTGVTGVKDIPCPHGKPGDRLWVREHYRVSNKHDSIPPRDIPARSCTVFFEAGGSLANQANGRWEVDNDFSAKDAGDWVGKFRPGMFMPRWASRITLDLTGVRVERLNDISEADARAEGIFSFEHFWRDTEYPLANVAYMPMPGWDTKYSSAVAAYEALWEHINGPRSWSANPWVWVEEFKPISKEQP
ncbi:MAG: hypothetical protein V4614_15180 [Pseudomonadota bacterium]